MWVLYSAEIIGNFTMRSTIPYAIGSIFKLNFLAFLQSLQSPFEFIVQKVFLRRVCKATYNLFLTLVKSVAFYLCVFGH